MKTRYAIKVALAADDWIYVTKKDDTIMFGMRPLLFKTREEAEIHADSWRLDGKGDYVKVVRYRGEEQ